MATVRAPAWLPYSLICEEKLMCLHPQVCVDGLL